jgi:uncharacterized protein YgiM (DUF1202 family)
MEMKTRTSAVPTVKNTLPTGASKMRNGTLEQQVDSQTVRLSNITDQTEQNRGEESRTQNRRNQQS